MSMLSNRKQKLTLTIAAIICCLFCVCYFGVFGDIKFSMKPGFYDDAISLSIKGGQFGKIYYTLDGSTPTKDSFEYTGAIELGDASLLPNRQSLNTNISIGFNTDLVDEFGGEQAGYVTPDYLIDKCHVVRAVYYNAFGDYVGEISGTYFIDFDAKPAYDNMAIVEVTTNPDNLWDYNTGIFCTGKSFDDFYQAVLLQNKGNTDYYFWRFWEANYNNEGYEWERPCQVTVYDENHELILDQKCGMRVQGNGSASESQKSINIFSREEYSNSNIFYTDLTNSGYYQHKYTITSCGQDQHYKVNDYLISQCMDDMNISTMDYRSCMLFLNGEFWGMYYIAEPFNKEYVEAHYGIQPDNVVLVKNEEIEEGEESDLLEYQQMQQFIIQNDMTVPDNYEKACALIDMESFIDYYVVMHYIGREGDWPGANEATWRARATSEKPYEDGKWRWMLFDLNGPEMQLMVDKVDNYEEQIYSYMWLSLIQNEQFKEQYAKTFWKLAKENFEPERMTEKLASFYNEYRDSLAVSNKRIYGQDYETELEQRIFDLNYYFLRRRDITPWIVAQFCGAQYNE